MKKKWFFENLKEEALKYNKRGDFQKGSPSAYVIARREGYLDHICSHMDPPKTKAYSVEELKKGARPFKRRMDFMKNSPSMYAVAWKRGILDDICSHMDSPSTKAYTVKEIEEGALKYSKCDEFKIGSPHLYNSACKKGILQIVTAHMSHSKNTSLSEKELFDYIKRFFKNAKKLRDKRVKIKNKPHIQGFDLDIYIPELNRAIEFDGEYWHSDAGLKRSRNHWPQEDIDNYHTIKDNYFLSKGIITLHIKEEDWIEDKEKCIQKCLEFLRKGIYGRNT